MFIASVKVATVYIQTGYPMGSASQLTFFFFPPSFLFCPSPSPSGFCTCAVRAETVQTPTHFLLPTTPPCAPLFFFPLSLFSPFLLLPYNLSIRISFST
ncbi:hypothetical protein BDZ91DRAFT_353150 [Kalaharituber pfeilii]|nr:hypothetical protein BDZ91DRAFT_353150 [Kalaharituber pfeilii]